MKKSVYLFIYSVGGIKNIILRNKLNLHHDNDLSCVDHLYIRVGVPLLLKNICLSKIIFKYMYYTINQFSRLLKYSEFVLNAHDHENIYIFSFQNMIHKKLGKLKNIINMLLHMTDHI